VWRIQLSTTLLPLRGRGLYLVPKLQLGNEEKGKEDEP